MGVPMALGQCGLSESDGPCSTNLAATQSLHCRQICCVATATRLISGEIQEWRLKWYGHVMRREEHYVIIIIIVVFYIATTHV